MSVIKSKSILYLFVIALVVSACAKEPYEDRVRKYFQESAKSGINLKSVEIDTVVAGENARPFLEKKLERSKERLTKSYEDLYLQTKNEIYKQRLDSARNGLFSDREYDIVYYRDLFSRKFRYEQITVTYKFGMQGDIQKQPFILRITDRDTIIRITDKDLKYFLMH